MSPPRPRLALQAERLPAAAARLRSELRAFLAEDRAVYQWTPCVDAWLSSPDPGFSRRIGARGWLGMSLPADYGGSGAGALARFVMVEELLAAGAPVACHWIADRQVAPAVLRLGSESQKQRYLPLIARGECFFAVGMSEPDAGSDLAAVRTRATRTDRGWRLDGTKLWTSGAHFAHAMIVLARTDPPDGDRHSGLSQFIVDVPHPRVTVRPIASLGGEHHFNEVHFDSAVVAPEAMLGTRGQGWNQVTAELAFERSGPERLLSTMPLLRAWAESMRREATRDLAAEQALGRLVARAWALRQMSLGVAASLAAGVRPDVEAALIKDLGSQFESEVTLGVRRHLGDSPDKRLARMLHDAILHGPNFTLRGGTNEILRSVVVKGMGIR